MIVAVSDVHGHVAQLENVMSQLFDDYGLNPNHDTLIFLGDIIDWGESPFAIYEFVRAMQSEYSNVICLMGNHEHMMLDAVCYNSATYGHFMQWWEQGGKITFSSFVPDWPIHKTPAPIVVKTILGDDVLDWFENLPVAYETDNYIFVHGGLFNYKDIDKTPKLEKLWLRTAFHQSTFDWGKRVIFGHTPFSEPLVQSNKIGIDTRGHNSGYITAVILDEDAVKEPYFVKSFETTT